MSLSFNVQTLNSLCPRFTYYTPTHTHLHSLLIALPYCQSHTCTFSAWRLCQLNLYVSHFLSFVTQCSLILIVSSHSLCVLCFSLSFWCSFPVFSPPGSLPLYFTFGSVYELCLSFCYALPGVGFIILSSDSVCFCYCRFWFPCFWVLLGISFYLCFSLCFLYCFDLCLLK